MIVGPGAGRVLAASLTAAALAVAGLATSQVITPMAGPAGDPAAGQDLFLDRCVSCHIPEGGGQGPSLKGVYGRRAGSVPGFGYSAAVRDSGVVWTAPELDRFLAGPSKALPGTAMPVSVPDARERGDLIAFLGSNAAR